MLEPFLLYSVVRRFSSMISRINMSLNQYVCWKYCGESIPFQAPVDVSVDFIVGIVRAKKFSDGSVLFWADICHQSNVLDWLVLLQLFLIKYHGFMNVWWSRKADFPWTLNRLVDSISRKWWLAFVEMPVSSISLSVSLLVRCRIFAVSRLYEPSICRIVRWGSYINSGDWLLFCC